MPLGDKTSYLGLEIGLAGAQLVGVDGLTFIANGSVLINKATNAAGLDSPDRINWFAATNATNDPANLIPAFSASLTDAVALQINGSAALDVFGAVLGTATFSITQGTQTIDTKNTAIGAAGVLTNASVMVMALSNLNLFAGVGGKLNQDPVTDVATVGIDTTGALGFSIVGGSVNMAIVRPAGLGPTDQTSYLGLEVSLAGAALIGIDGLKLNARRHGIGEQGHRRRRHARHAEDRLGHGDGQPAAGLQRGLTSGVDLRIAGSASLDIFGFVVGTASFTMAQGTTNVTTGNGAIGTAGTLNNAAVMGITLSNLNLFAGTGGALNDNNTPTPTDDAGRPEFGDRLQHRRRQRGAGAGAPGNDQPDGQDQLPGRGDLPEQRVPRGHRRADAARERHRAGQQGDHGGRAGFDRPHQLVRRHQQPPTTRTTSSRPSART